eukprot:TRINITY_DN24979_c0_g1_i1.p1 TRINITY_DN24979_c0_g1~~TRINITY_DN24979_c0_g1_i1.p1  ORF type:complete len:844 (+),score=284.44 TRINITY_DN24979_c0_g1_i1:88-2532(+)
MAEADYFAMMAEAEDAYMDDIDDAAMEAAAEAEADMVQDIDSAQQRRARIACNDALPPAPAGTDRQIHFSQTSSCRSGGAAADAMCVRGANGVVKYINIAPVDEEDDVNVAPRWAAMAPGQLLCGTTIRELSDRHQENLRVRKADAAKAEQEEKQARAVVVPRQPTQLLVDKYCPKRYVDLTSAEDVNFSVLEWFKAWDTTVFPKEGKGGGKAAKEKKAAAAEDTRPEKKVLLISGPPGAGKTTLATVIAAHCGYLPVNINASMDRTASALDERIAAAATGAATLDMKPNCLILDEVDGVASASGAGVLGKLIKLATADWKVKGKKPIQMRPVVCICNNPWEKELRGLREVAEHLIIDTVRPKKLTTRLREICHTEQVDADDSFLSELAAVSNGDIRSCLFSLQFLSQRYQAKRLTAKQISGVGVKDRVHSFADVMETIFHADDQKATQALARLDTSNSARYSGKRSVVLLRYIAGGHPEMEKLYEAAFEEYPQARYHDYNMKKTSDLLRTLALLDQFLTTAREKAAFGIEYVYAPQALVAFHMTCQAPKFAKKRWQYPKTFGAQKRKVTRSKELLDSVLGTRRSSVPWRTMVLDYLSPLLAVLAPRTLWTNKGSFAQDTDDELKALKAAAQLYLAQGLTFKEQDVYDTRFAAPQRKLKLYPDLDSLAFYGKQHRPFPPLKEDMRRKLVLAIRNAAIYAENAKAAAAKPVPSAAPAPSPKKRKADAVKQQNAQPPSALAGISKTVGTAANPAKRVKTTRDLFGNVRTQRLAAPTGKTSGLATHEMFDAAKGCKYEQNQGFTNAVRKRCSIRHWL